MVGLVISIVVIGSMAEVPYTYTGATNSISIGKVSLDYFTPTRFTSLPAKPAGSILSEIPLSWFQSAPPAFALNQSGTGTSSSNYVFSPSYGYSPPSTNYAGGGILVYYDNYYYNIVVDYGGSTGDLDYLYATAIDTRTAVTGTFGYQWSSAQSTPYTNVQYVEEGFVSGSTLYFLADMGATAYIVSCTLGAGSLSNWNSYEVVSGGVPEAIAVSGSDWYVAVAGLGVYESTSGVGGPYTQIYSGLASTDVAGMVITQNGALVLVYYTGISGNSGTGYAMQYYQNGAWSSTYSITQSDFDPMAGRSLTTSGVETMGPVGQFVASEGNTVIVTIPYYSPGATANAAIYVSNFTVGTSSGWSALKEVGSNSGELHGYFPLLFTYNNDVYMIITSGKYNTNTDTWVSSITVLVSSGDYAEWKTLYSNTLTADAFNIREYGSIYGSAEGYPGLVTLTGNDIAVIWDSYNLYLPDLAAAFTVPSSLSQFQISVSGIQASGQYIKASSSAASNTANVNLEILAGHNASQMTEVSNYTWNDVSLPFSDSYTTPWLNLASATTQGYYNYTYEAQVTVSGVNAITGSTMSQTATLQLQNKLYWSTTYSAFDPGYTQFNVIGGNMTPTISLPANAINMLIVTWTAIAFLAIWLNRKEKD
jgi:hypothetical protein